MKTMSKQQLVISEIEDQERIDKIVTYHFSSFSRTEIQQLIKSGHVTVNDQRVKPNYRCQTGDVLSISFPEEETLQLNPENIPLDIVYEDDYLLIVNKPKGMVVYPTDAHTSGTLVNALLHHTTELSRIGGEERPGIVHRLDKDTSGIILIAKKDEVHKRLSEQFKENKVERLYGALVHGDIPHQTGIINAPIGRDPKYRTRMAVLDDGREAITHFEVIERFGDYTFVECKLITGRTHQIRVHFQYIGHSIVGEQTYINHKTLQTGGQLLFAKSLRFIHPITKEQLHFEVPIPTFFQEVMKNLGVDYE